MIQINESLRQEIMEMAEKDLSVREDLAADGSLAKEGYHPKMEAVHKINAFRLETIIKQHGWPGKSLVGEEGAEAAWLIAQHAIGNPPFMKRCLFLLKQAASNNDVLPWQAAFIEDRIRMYEGKPQIYGTQFRWNENRECLPYAIENPNEVNDRRRAIGLNTLEERIAELKDQLTQEPMPLPSDWDWKEHERKYEEWLLSAGWRP